ncbi:hypothetical protein OG590_03145 [Streptomyces goshikiensis]|uniref:hypothetical protein n=1 Tax=Streptomyces TaxID=1883 RepID=UPI00056472D8|nr:MULTISPECIES: hypothetical protein [Streptomyces]AKL69244.1 hypothetical protein M444_31890 [Streptomyces sp. Mg1]RPK33026.1 hypothetical protein EES37_31930 [Streptomyces sp. ADI91-18]WBY23576.1 hypothetical protein PET44_30320 [Streptomyces goshikiensis]WSS02474.1 hypothetical protein OG224_32880 [Streptomyces goshikiensis]WSX96301.1 hypothetical protein OG590_03145 [Streptomyces goshikiensis]
MTDQRTSDLPDRMRERLAGLRRDHDKGQAQLQRLMREEAATRDALLRVGGAIRILEELLPEDETPRTGRAGEDGAAPAAAPAEANSRPKPGPPRTVHVP